MRYVSCLSKRCLWKHCYSGRNTPLIHLTRENELQKYDKIKLQILNNALQQVKEEKYKINNFLLPINFSTLYRSDLNKDAHFIFKEKNLVSNSLDHQDIINSLLARTEANAHRNDTLSHNNNNKDGSDKNENFNGHDKYKKVDQIWFDYKDLFFLEALGLGTMLVASIRYNIEDHYKNRKRRLEIESFFNLEKKKISFLPNLPISASSQHMTYINSNETKENCVLSEIFGNVKNSEDIKNIFNWDVNSYLSSIQSNLQRYLIQFNKVITFKAFNNASFVLPKNQSHQNDVGIKDKSSLLDKDVQPKYNELNDQLNFDSCKIKNEIDLHVQGESKKDDFIGVFKLNFGAKNLNSKITNFRDVLQSYNKLIDQLDFDSCKKKNDSNAQREIKKDDFVGVFSLNFRAKNANSTITNNSCMGFNIKEPTYLRSHLQNKSNFNVLRSIKSEVVLTSDKYISSQAKILPDNNLLDFISNLKEDKYKDHNYCKQILSKEDNLSSHYMNNIFDISESNKLQMHSEPIIYDENNISNFSLDNLNKNISNSSNIVSCSEDSTSLINKKILSLIISNKHLSEFITISMKKKFSSKLDQNKNDKNTNFLFLSENKTDKLKIEFDDVVFYNLADKFSLKYLGSMFIVKRVNDFALECAKKGNANKAVCLWERSLKEEGGIYGTVPYNLALSYQLGIGVNKNLSKAKELYELGGKLNHAKSLYCLSLLLLTSSFNSVKQSQDMTSYKLENKGLKCYAYSDKSLEGILLKVLEDISGYSIDKVIFSDCLTSLTKAADLGSKEAQRELGIFNLIRVDSLPAIQLFKAAIDQKDHKLANLLDLCYKEGIEISKDEIFSNSSYLKSNEFEKLSKDLSIGNYPLSTNKLSTNQLSANQLSTNQLPANQLPTYQLSTNQLSTKHLSTNQISTNQLSTNQFISTDSIFSPSNSNSLQSFSSSSSSCSSVSNSDSSNDFVNSKVNNNNNNNESLNKKKLSNNFYLHSDNCSDDDNFIIFEN